jgi:hypothetical protein
LDGLGFTVRLFSLIGVAIVFENVVFTVRATRTDPNIKPRDIVVVALVSQLTSLILRATAELIRKTRPSVPVPFCRCCTMTTARSGIVSTDSTLSCMARWLYQCIEIDITVTG